jgi:predicted nucleic acid-binding protein
MTSSTVGRSGWVAQSLPDGDYLLGLAFSRRSLLVTGDQHLLGLRNKLPIIPPAEFVTKLRQDA